LATHQSPRAGIWGALPSRRRATSSSHAAQCTAISATLWAQFDASERNLAHLRPGKNISVLSPAFRDQSFTARVEAISDFLDPGTRALKIRARIDNKDNKLKAEMFVTAEVDADGEKELLVPAKSVFFQNEKYFLFIDESNGSYQRREVKTGDVRNNLVEILSGLNAGEKVVTEGTLMLQQVMSRST
jgi:cobalt-zinc-cadmium efflux system membrane fusion protein